MCGSGDDPETAVAVVAVNGKIPLIQCENGVYVLPLGQVDQGGVGEIGFNLGIPAEESCQPGHGGFVYRKQRQKPTFKSTEQSFDGLGVVTQQPLGLGHYRPAGKQRWTQGREFCYAALVLLIGFRKNGDDRASVDEDALAPH